VVRIVVAAAISERVETVAAVWRQSAIEALTGVGKGRGKQLARRDGDRLLVRDKRRQVDRLARIEIHIIDEEVACL
jgi:hypothetical protein